MFCKNCKRFLRNSKSVRQTGICTVCKKKSILEMIGKINFKAEDERYRKQLIVDIESTKKRLIYLESELLKLQKAQ